MNRALSIFASVLVLSAFAAADGEQQLADLGSCKVESGENIQNCRIGYRTWGTLNSDKSNVVVMMTWFTGTSEQLASNVGADNYVDPAKFYVVAIDALANGVSSSPSNSTAQPRMKFPKITIADMVETQRRLLIEKLGLKHVHAVLGTSMGGMQAFQWAVQYPEFMDWVIPIVGSPQLMPHDLLLWRAEKNAIVDSKEWKDGNYKAGLRINAVADVHHLELETPDRLNDEVQLTNYQAAAEKMEADESFDPNDRIRQLDAMMAHDISKQFNGQLYVASRAVKAKFLIVVAKQDHMVSSRMALTFAEFLFTTPVELESNCGHLAPGCEAALVIPAVHRALEMK